MPRIYVSNNDPLDFCRDHFPTEEEAETAYGDVNLTGSGPDDRGNCFSYDAEHPQYEHERCVVCGKQLGDDDE